MSDHEILFNALLEEWDDVEVPIVRYLQCGIADASGFTGRVTDYCGGGGWDDCYYLDGERLEPEDVAGEDADEDELDEVGCDEYEAFLDRHHPGLPEAIHTRRAELCDWVEGSAGFYPIALPALLTLRTSPTDEMVSDALGRIDPVDGFNTSF